MSFSVTSLSRGRQKKYSKFGWQAFLWDAWMKCKTVSNPKSPKKYDTVYHFGPSQMVLELINIRQSFPNNLINNNAYKYTLYNIHNMHYTICRFIYDINILHFDLFSYLKSCIYCKILPFRRNYHVIHIHVYLRSIIYIFYIY